MSRRESSADASATQKAELKQKRKDTTAAIEQLRKDVVAAILSARVASPLSADGATLAPKIKKRRTLQGHFNKVVSVAWHSDSVRCITSSQDGNVITWDTHKQCKKFLTPLSSAWVMFAENSKEGPEQFMSGGLDNIMTLWACPGQGTPGRAIKEFHGHDGYVCSGRFLSGGNKLLTISGDKTIGKWDVNYKAPPNTEDERESFFAGHEKDVTSIDMKPGSASEFITSSADGSVMLWDLSSNKPTGALRLGFPGGYDGPVDVNKAKYQANGNGVGMATEASGSYLYDVRCRNAVNSFGSDAGSAKASAKYSCSFSLSGRLLFVGCEDFSVEVWDTTIPDAKKATKVCSSDFSNRVSDLAVAPNGGGCVAVSWDTSGCLYAP